MSDMIAALRQAAETGKTITLAYGAGSRPGKERDLVIAACTDSEIRVFEKGSRFPKSYKLTKVLWVLDESGHKILNQPSIETFNQQIPAFQSIADYDNHFRAEFENVGWLVEGDGAEFFSVGTYFKNGKPRKTPSVLIAYYDPSLREDLDIDGSGDIIYVPHQVSGNERPWRVDSWRFEQGKTFKNLQFALEVFTDEVRASDPKTAKII